MWSLSKPLNLIRYLIVWRVNSSLTRLPENLSADLSRTLGTIIADRLPTNEARPWHKALELWTEYMESVPEQKNSKRRKRRSSSNDQLRPIPEAPWPIESVLFPYPGKRTNGQGELIIWELKLFGESADHNLFLEVILPAMEEASTSNTLNRNNKHSFWGHFDIYAVYAARGKHWEPFIQAGQLDLSYRPNPIQWAESLTFGSELSKPLHTIIWLTPFEFGDIQIKPKKSSRSRRRRKKKISQKSLLPTLENLIGALLIRISQLLPGKYTSTDDVWAMLNPEEEAALKQDLEWVSHSPIKHHTLKSAPKGWTRNWIGSQTFPSIPNQIIPYLELASILHIGKQTHFGHGTFAIR
jgi:hypothetical protein